MKPPFVLINEYRCNTSDIVWYNPYNSYYHGSTTYFMEITFRHSPKLTIQFKNLESRDKAVKLLDDHLYF